MKKVATVLSVIAIMAFAACADNSDSNKSGNNNSEQVEEPVLNSGPETEAERAKEAVKDSTAAGSDSTIRRDADAPSTPH